MPYTHGAKDITGETFNRLTVLRYIGKSKWLCRCSCGSICKINTGKLKTGHTKSCGCLMREHYKKIVGLPNGKHDKTRTAVDFLLKAYRKQAAERELSFSLDKEKFCDLINKNCFYCGDAPFREYKRGNVDKILYSGIDRIDSSVGYEPTNCVPCCKTCNTKKSWLSIDQFENSVRKKVKEVEWAIRVYRYWLNESI